MMLRSFLMACAITISAFPVFADEVKMPRSVTVQGHGEVRVAPDMGVVSIGVASQAETARDALTANSEAMTRILSALKAAGIADKDIQTSNFSVQPRYDYNNNAQPRLTGYDVSNTVTVTVRQLASLGAVLDQVVSAGSNQINGIMFDVAKPDAALDEARKLAAADAARKARLYATSMSFALGEVLSLSETSVVLPPVYGKETRVEGLAADVPIAAGEQKLAIDVTITWEIK